MTAQEHEARLPETDRCGFAYTRATAIIPKQKAESRRNQGRDVGEVGAEWVSAFGFRPRFCIGHDVGSADELPPYELPSRAQPPLEIVIPSAVEGSAVAVSDVRVSEDVASKLPVIRG